ncbi:uncharacterized protein LOC105200011 [Solenopsis invicta]|uniref:uncharacterized protein LOC105200011 n=1 Tax=Solenopsis invicta TaxID=13686 RepID=UPI00193D4630|nr:uncharacterized protein LOC105200011 [Solenopsis invicta]
MPLYILNTEHTKICTKKDFQTNENLSNSAATQNKSENYIKTEDWFKTELKWLNIISIGLLHLYFLYVCLTFKFLENLKTTVWLFIMYVIGGFGTTGGIHRLWTHRAYKAKGPFRIILLICYISAGLNNPYDWVRDHRTHHKYTDTNADPHNSSRGFFFSHVGWLMMKKHPEVIQKGRQIDMSDVLADPIFVFGTKYFSILKFMFTLLLPIMLPVYGWNETWYRAFVSQAIIRYVVVLNATWSVNSAAHIWGSKPFDAHINPTENSFVSFITAGEGWHNYHHVFPWDYKASELIYSNDLTTKVINFFAKVGWTYDLKEASEELVKTIVMKNGDGSHHLWDAVPYPDSKIVHMMLDISEISVIKTEKSINNKVSTKELDKTHYELKIVWRNVIIFTFIHLAAIYGLYLYLFRAKCLSFIWFTLVGFAGGFGITVGAHRLWAHRSYKAKWPMRLILMIFNTVAFEDDIYQWVRDHRVHHKFVDTDADPYNVRRGFFFSHMGWLLVRKHPDVIKKGATIDCSDVIQDPIVAFQRKWYMYLMPLCCFIIPALIPWLAWNENLWYSWYIAVFRYCTSLHLTWMVNSVAHMWGMKPYDKSLTATNNVGVGIFAFGEGWHNYHHVFPWDYKASEFGNYRCNFSTAFIDFFAYLGLAYDLKTVPADMIKKRILRNGEVHSY